jgi:hypothetical protein
MGNSINGESRSMTGSEACSVRSRYAKSEIITIDLQMVAKNPYGSTKTFMQHACASFVPRHNQDFSKWLPLKERGSPVP